MIPMRLKMNLTSPKPNFLEQEKFILKQFDEKSKRGALNAEENKLNPEFNSNLIYEEDDFVVKTAHSLSYELINGQTCQARDPIPKECLLYYFEIQVLSFNEFDGEEEIVVGFSEKGFPFKETPGKTTKNGDSFGYCSSGNVYYKEQKMIEIRGFRERAKVGCGINLLSKEIFFTRNGIIFSKKIKLEVLKDLYPTISIAGPENSVRIVFKRSEFMFKYERYSLGLIRSILEEVKKEHLEDKEIRNLVHNYLYINGCDKTLMSFEDYFLIKRDDVSKRRKKLKGKNSKKKNTTDIGKDKEKEFSAASSLLKKLIPFRRIFGAVRGKPEKKEKKGTKIKNEMDAPDVIPYVAKEEYSDETAINERGIIRNEILKGETNDADQIIYLFFPNLIQSSEEIQGMLKVQNFLNIFNEGRNSKVKALSYARDHLLPLQKKQFIFPFVNKKLKIERMGVKELMVLFTLKDIQNSKYKNLLGKAQRELVADKVNSAILDYLGFNKESNLESCLQYMKAMTSMLIKKNNGFLDVFELTA